MVIELLKEGDSLKESLQKLEWGTLNEEQHFNLLVFNSFCYFQPICASARMKQGCRHTIKEMLKAVLLQGVAQLFNKKVAHTPSLEVLNKRGKVLYAKFQAILDKIPWEASPSSQHEASNAFASAIYADEYPNLIRGLSLYVHFMETYWHMRKEFSKMFLVEEEDFDWRAIVGT